MASSSSTQMTIGEYIVDVSNHLGSGAMGIVHPATDAEGKRVAAKRICGKTEKSMDRVSKDLHRLKDLDHANIIKFFNITQQTSEVWIFMEFCPHGDLGYFLQTHLEITKSQTFDIMIQIAKGVEYLHKNNIIHRNIKPTNILVSTIDPILVKLTDFDFSKFLEEDYITSLMTTNVGTPAFKAPEFYLRNEKKKINYHRNVDIYALGLTYLAMIQGNKGLVPQIETPSDDSELYAPVGRVIAERIRYKKKPLHIIPEEKTGGSIVEWFSKLFQGGGNSTALSSSGSAPVPYEVKLMKSLIRKMTHHEPENRPSAAQVVQDLHRIQQQVNYNAILMEC